MLSVGARELGIRSFVEFLGACIACLFIWVVMQQVLPPVAALSD